MPGVYNDDQFVNISPTLMNARVQEVLDDVPGQFGEQKKYIFNDVEVLETNTGESYVPRDGIHIVYCKQSSSPNSKDAAVTKAWNAFARDHFNMSGGARMVNFYDKLLTFKEVEVTEASTSKDGREFAAGKFLVPVAIVGQQKAPVTPPESLEDIEAPAIDERLVALVIELVGEDGTTEALLTRELTKNAGRKKSLESAGGIKALLAAMSDRISVEDGAVTLITEQPDADSIF